MDDVEKQRASWWSPRLLEVLTARYAIVVEGISDRVMVEAAARVMGIHLDRLGAVVFDIDGADKFRHIYKLIGKDGFSVPILGLVDDAESASWTGAIGGKPKSVLDSTIFVSKPDLEGEYAAAFTGPGTARALIRANFCKEDSVVQACGATKLDDISEEKVAAYCRKDKVGASVALATQLDTEIVANILSVHKLLQRLVELSAR